MNKTIVNVAQVKGKNDLTWFSAPVVVTVVERKSIPIEQNVEDCRSQTKTECNKNLLMILAYMIACR